MGTSKACKKNFDNVQDLVSVKIVSTIPIDI